MITRSDEYILLAVWRLENTDEGAYGSSVLDFLESFTDSSWSLAGVYAPLRRMAGFGLLLSSTGLPTPHRGGRRKRLYTVTAQGQRVLHNARSEYSRMWIDVAFSISGARAS